MKRRIGIYSGTFDPVHNGHIGFALRAADEAALDGVVFVPEKLPRGKDQVTDLQHRFELLLCGTAPYGVLSVRLLDADRFTVSNALPELRAMFEDADLYLLVGSDVVKTFADRWDDLDELFGRMKIIVGIRAGDTLHELKKLLRGLHLKTQGRCMFVNSPMASASSTRVRSGQGIRDVPPEVSSYIKQHRLYSR